MKDLKIGGIDMNVNADNLEKVFNLPTNVIEGEFTVEGKELDVVKPTPIAEVKQPVEKLEDSDYIRKSLKDLADGTKDALELALQIQADDPNARNTEAVAKMADAVTKALTSLIHLNKTEEEKNAKATQPEVQQNVTNNNIVIATTEDLISKIIEQTNLLKGNK